MRSTSINDLLRIGDGDDSRPHSRRRVNQSYREIPPSEIVPNPRQPRKTFDEGELADLASSIAKLGVIQPILVRARADGKFELVAGERRWRAAQMARLDKIPAIIGELTELQSLERSIVENLQRSQLNPIEEAEAYQRLIDDFNFTQEKVAERMGKSRPAITNTLRLLTLPMEVRDYVRDGFLSPAHARTLVSLYDAQAQREIADEVIREGHSVRVLEQMVRDILNPEKAVVDPDRISDMTPEVDYGYVEVETRLSAHLQTAVVVKSQRDRKNGEIVIEFADANDLARLYELIKPPLTD